MLGSIKTSDTISFVAVPPEATNAGQSQTGGWASNPGAVGVSFPCEVAVALPACIRVLLPAGSNPTVTRLAPSQYSVTLSLSGTNSVTLVPAGGDAQGNQTAAVSPNAFVFSLTSRNSKVATVSGLTVNAVARGECEVLVKSPRQVNLAFTNAAPSNTEAVAASLNVIVTA